MRLSVDEPKPRDMDEVASIGRGGIKAVVQGRGGDEQVMSVRLSARSLNKNPQPKVALCNGSSHRINSGKYFVLQSA